MVVVVVPTTVVRHGVRLRHDCGRPPLRSSPAAAVPAADLPTAVVVVSPRSRASSAAPAVSARPARARRPPTRPAGLADNVRRCGGTQVEGGGGARWREDKRDLSFFLPWLYVLCCVLTVLSEKVHSTEYPKFNIGACVEKISMVFLLPAIKKQGFLLVY